MAVATLPPSLLPHSSPQRELPELRTLVVAGEVCAEGEMLMRRWAEGRLVINAYGPTEATVCATAACYRPGDPPARIGRALRGVTLHVLDADGAPVPVGVEGELLIGGIGVARGYLNRPCSSRPSGSSRVPNSAAGAPSAPAMLYAGSSPACLNIAAGSTRRSSSPASVSSPTRWRGP
ncbi:MAG: AMP-binding protein [Geminicoccaceae bacterium]